MKLTVRRRRVLFAIVDHTRVQGYAPTLREIGEMVGLTGTSSVNHHVQALRRAGLLSPGVYDQSRSLALAEGVAVSRNGLVARAVAISHCPRCLLSLPEDHGCHQSRPEENHA